MRKYFGLLAATGLLSVPAAGFAAVPTLSEVLGASGIAATGHLSGGYSYFTNDGPSPSYRQFDTSANSFKFNQADVVLSYLPTEGFGIAIEGLAGDDARAVNAALGSGNSDFALPQAYLQYAEGNWTVIGGRYWTLAGAEVTDDSLDSNISRSFLFTYAEAFTHTGVRVGYKFSDTLTGYAGVSNTAFAALGSSTDNNKQKTAEVAITYAPTSTLSFALSDYYGVDPNAFGGSSTDARVNYLDGVATIGLTPSLQFVLNGDYARFIPVNDSVGSGYVYGFAGYLNYSINDKWRTSLRGEYVKTKNVGLSPLAIAGDPTTGDSCALENKCELTEVTATVGYAAAKNFDLLGEVRYDLGDNVYADSSTSSGYTDNQTEFEVKAIFKFGTPKT